MKLKTQKIDGILIVTCNGLRLDASFAKSFFTAIQGLIQKGHLDIILDLSSVEFVDSSGLGAIVRCLKEIDNRGQLVLCGVSKMFFNLLEMTHLHGFFPQAPNRDEALKLLIRNKKKQTEKSIVIEDLAEPLVMDDNPVEEITNDERRQHPRIAHTKILSDDIIVYWSNIRTGKHSTGVIVDISPGGILMVSPSRHAIGDELILQGTIGTTFKFKEQAVIRSDRNGKYGLEFIKLSPETSRFLNQLIGSVRMDKGSFANKHS